ncbi:PTS system mannose/fructose/sorbose family transporter subunit IID [Vagococcus intermedius]|uniref:PTS system mannose/fructose/sorbose family transporter subunit IID n=1 Tax=Vagococcus intermedius TaxID=2991418 RepID=A0AAF0CVK2_9ENTE|nr:PTS system mannose/fructose/sorbose family transporter subunit IID [Vagococcus intermedius]WEG73641.1 PTS system mannose/fructose/sorbose family transporter subunit IID [Vagococcus intermedius]WEG75725.1 PTS system mannose/fructose/sorbose family transporter subunit IID [Vagococcus intermedius]
MAEQNNSYKLTKKDRLSVFWRSQFLQASWNYERMQNVGWAYAMIPALKKLYTTKEDRAEALKRHLEFFNTHPYLASPILGVTLTLEEEKAAGAEIDNAAIQGVKIGMMGPLAGVGDPIFWGTIRPVLGAFAASMALSGNIMGPIIFFLAWNLIRMGFLWNTQELGYRQGSNITQNLGGGVMQKITQGASILGMFIMGVLVPRWTTMNFPTVVSKVVFDPAKNAQDADKIVDFTSLISGANQGKLETSQIREVAAQIQQGRSISGEQVTTLGDIFNQLIPGLMPLLLTFLCIYLLRKKVSPIVIIFGLFVVGILGYVLGIFA